MHSVVPGQQPALIIDPPPVPVLLRVLPTRWWSQASWPDPNWRSGLNWTFSFSGENFAADSIVMFGPMAVRADRVSSRELEAWVVPPREPVTLPVRVRSGILVSNPIPFTFR